MLPFYVVTDCEFDGPTPGANSMLSFGSVAVSATGSILGDSKLCWNRLTELSATQAPWRFGIGTRKPGRPRQKIPKLAPMLLDASSIGFVHSKGSRSLQRILSRSMHRGSTTT